MIIVGSERRLPPTKGISQYPQARMGSTYGTVGSLGGEYKYGLWEFVGSQILRCPIVPLLLPPNHSSLEDICLSCKASGASTGSYHISGMPWHHRRALVP